MISYTNKLAFNGETYYEISVSSNLINKTESWLNKHCSIKYSTPIVIGDRFVGKYYCVLPNNLNTESLLDERIKESESASGSAILSLIFYSERINKEFNSGSTF